LCNHRQPGYVIRKAGNEFPRDDPAVSVLRIKNYVLNIAKLKDPDEPAEEQEPPLRMRDKILQKSPSKSFRKIAAAGSARYCRPILDESGPFTEDFFLFVTSLDREYVFPIIVVTMILIRPE
jgi:hypothetical protein